MPKKIQKKKKNKTEPRVQETRPKDFLDLIAPAAVKFNTDHYICGSLYHCTLALRSYPATTEEPKPLMAPCRIMTPMAVTEN